MKKIVMIGLVLAILLVTAAGAMAKGDCDRDMWGHDEQWQPYDGVNENVEVSTCVSKYRSSHVDVRNDNSYPICVTISNNKGQRWSDWPLQPNKILSKQTSGEYEVTWRIGAKRMEGVYCR